MKQIFCVSAILIFLGSCSLKKEASNLNGRTDEVYFTVNDTRKKSLDLPSYDEPSSLQNSSASSQSNAGNYTSTYANRFRNFGSSQRFNYNYQPTIVPSLMYSSYSGWGMGISYSYSMPGYGINSPFSPYYGCYMPYYNPFYSYGWGATWMTGYYPYYVYNPYLFNYGYYNPYYGYYGGYYDNYYYGNSGSGGNTRPTQYARRTGYNNGQPSGGSSTSQPQNSSYNNNNNSGNSNNRWYSSGSSDRGGSRYGGSSGSGGSNTFGSGSYGGGSGSSGGGGGSRSSSGSSSGGSRRR